MATGSILTLAAFSSQPSPPPTGYLEMYVVGTTIYIQDPLGNLYAFGSTNAITQLTGDVSAVGPGSVVATVNSVGGQSASNIAAATTAYLNATASNMPGTLVLRDGSGNFSANIITASLNGNASTATNANSAINFTGSLSGDVTGTQSATTVAFVGGSSAANVHSAEVAANAATASDTPSTIVKRDALGSFSANVITVTMISGGSASFSGTIGASNLSGTNTGDVTVSNTNSIALAFSSGQSGLNATLNLSAASPDTGYIPAYSQIKSDGLLVEVLAGTPVQIGTSNNPGSAASAARSDHVHAITSSVVLGLLLTGYTTGTNTPITATNTILQAFQNLQAQITAISGAVTSVGAYNGGTANANGATIASNVIYFQSASTSFPGMVDTTTQSFAGNKTFTGTVVAQSIEANGTGGNGFVQIDNQSATPSAPPSGNLKLYANTTNGFNRTRELDSGGASFALDRDLYEIVYNNSGATISKGQLVYINGVYTGGSPNVPTIALAQANSANTAPAFGMCYDTIANNSFGRVFTNGNITGINLTGFTNGQPVWLSSSVAGGLTATEPLSPNISQLVGYITNAAASGNIDLSIRAALNTSSGTYRSSFQIGPNSGSSAISLAFANAFIAMLQWNPTAAFNLLLPPTQPTMGQYLGAADNAGTLQWTNPLVNIDGGSAPSVYTPAQYINGGTP